MFTIIQTALWFNHIDCIHSKTDSQTNAHPSDLTWSKILYMPINWINLINCKMSVYIFFSLTDVLHHDRVMMEGKMNQHWHMSSCIAILNIEDIHQKTCHVVIYFVIYLPSIFLKTKLRWECNYHNEFYGHKILYELWYIKLKYIQVPDILYNVFYIKNYFPLISTWKPLLAMDVFRVILFSGCRRKQDYFFPCLWNQSKSVIFHVRSHLIYFIEIKCYY